MLENARRQLFLVLLSIVAGILCCVFWKIPLGHDLKGGTQLRYEVPKDIIKAIAEKEKLPIEKMMEDAIKIIAERIDPNGVLDPLITQSGETGILIELPYFDNPQELANVIARIGNLGKLEFRMVADDAYASLDGVSFQMATEKQLLKSWLQNPENAKKIKDDFHNIRIFNEAAPPLGPQKAGLIAWYPRLIKPDTKGKGGGKVWDRSYEPFPAFTNAVVPAYEPKDYNNGQIPEEYQKLPADQQFLVEFIAVNMKEQHFEGKDLDPASVGPGQMDGKPGVNYMFDAGHVGAYAEWSAKYKDKPSAIILNGVVKSAPTFQGKITGMGIITGDFTSPEVDELVKVLKTGSLRVEPALVSKEVIGPTLGAKAIERGAYSLAAGTLLVFVFMLRKRKHTGDSGETP